MAGDVSYVGNHGINRLGATQNGSLQNLNAVDIGAAYLPQNQDLTLGTSATPGADGLQHESAASLPGFLHNRREHDGFL